MNQSLPNDSRIIEQQIDFATRLCELEEYSQAESYLKILAQKYPNNPQIWYLLSYVAAQQKQYTLAIQQIKKAIECDPQDFSFYSNLGNLYTNQKQYVLAIQYYQKALSIQPNNSSLYKSLGFIYGLQGDLATATFNYAVAEEKEGNFLAAIKYYQKAIQAKSDYVSAYYHLGNLYYQQQDLERAIEYYQQVVQLEKDHLEAHYCLALSYQALKRFAPAIYNYEQVIKLKPNYQEAYLNLSIIYKEQGNLVKALEACQNALQHQAETAKSFHPLGNVVLKNPDQENQQLQHQENNSQRQIEQKSQEIIEEIASQTTHLFDYVAQEKAQISTVTIKKNNHNLVNQETPGNIFFPTTPLPTNVSSQHYQEELDLIEQTPKYNFNYIEKEIIVQRILDNEYNFIVTAFFAEDNIQDALLLLSYLERTEFSFCLYQTPKIHQSVSIAGDINSLDYTKPSYFAAVYQALLERELDYERKSNFTHLLYVNSALFLNLESKTIAFLQSICDREIDFAIYNCAKNSDVSQIYAKVVEPNFLVSSAAIQLYSLSDQSLLIWHTWQEAIIKYAKNLNHRNLSIFPGDATFLDYVWNNSLVHQSEIKYAWLTQENFSYCCTPLTRSLII